MKRFLLALHLVLFAWLLAPVRTPALFAADRIRLALPAKSMGYLPLFVAAHRGYCKDEALEVETPMMLPQLAQHALLSGDVDFHGVAALTAGSVNATVVVPPDNVLLRQKGFRELLLLGDASEFPSNGYSTTERQLNENRHLTKRLLRALYRSLHFARERPEEPIPILEREWRVDANTAKESYAAVAKSFSKDGVATEAGLKIHLKLVQAGEQTIAEIPLSKIVNFRPLEEVRRELVK